MNSPAPSTPTTKNVFSPVSVASSPVSKMSQKGNLTGLPRNVRDLIAEFYTQMQTWETAYLEGTLVITKMTALKLFDGSQRKTKLDPKLQELCDSLELVLQQLDKIILTMKRIRRELDVMTHLREVQDNDYDSPENPLFLTWPISKFVETVSYITTSYQMELETGKLVAEKIGLSRDFEEFTFYESAWTQEPMLFADVISLKIEAALLETGLR